MNALIIQQVTALDSLRICGAAILSSLDSMSPFHSPQKSCLESVTARLKENTSQYASHIRTFYTGYCEACHCQGADLRSKAASDLSMTCGCPPVLNPAMTH